MNTIPNIGHPTDLKPQARHFVGSDETFVNADGIIEICRRIDTPQAKAVYRAFRKRLVEIRVTDPLLTAGKQREKAILAAIGDVGWNVTLTPAPGSAA